MSYSMEEHLSYVSATPEYAEVKEPKLVKRQTVASADGYMIRLLQLGAMEGALGEMDINPLLQPVIEAMHQVLAGGEVEIKLVTAGNPLLVEELKSRLVRATEDLNTINRQAEYSVLPRT